MFFPPIAGLMRTMFELIKTAPRVHALGVALDARIEAQGKRANCAALRLPPAMPCEIRFERVSFAYGEVSVLNNVSFVWKPGEVLGIQGPNGSGKSTLLKLMLGLIEPTEGRILVGGVDLREIDLTAWRRRIVYLPQRPYVPEKATVIEAMRLSAPGLGEDEARKGLEEMGVWERLVGHRKGVAHESIALQTMVSTLSVGTRQRMMLARIVGAKSPSIVMDEPDENLDAQARGPLMRRAKERHAARGIVVATHDAQVLAVCGTTVALG